MGGNHLQVTVISVSHFCTKSWQWDQVHTLWQTCLIQQLVLCLRSVVIRCLIEPTGRAGKEWLTYSCGKK